MVEDLTVQVYSDCLFQINKTEHGYQAELWDKWGYHHCSGVYEKYDAVLELCQWAANVLKKSPESPDFRVLNCGDFIYRGWICLALSDWGFDLQDPLSASTGFDLHDPLGTASTKASMSREDAISYIDQVERERLVSPGQLSLLEVGHG